MDENITVVNPATPAPEAQTLTDKTFTQKDVDDIVINRLAKERAKIYKQIGIEEEGKIEEYKNRVKEYETLKQENETFKSERETREYKDKLKKLGADDDFLDFLLTKISKDEKFEENAQTFLKDNPKFTKEIFKNFDSNLPLTGGSGPVDLSKMSTGEYIAYRAKNKL